MRPPRPAPGVPPAGSPTGNLIMALLLASLTMGFGAVFAFYLIMRHRAPAWPPAGTPALPTGLWLSTALLLASSMTLAWATRALRDNRLVAFQTGLRATLALAAAFLVSQGVNWTFATRAGLPPGRNMYAVTFYLLSGIHAAHTVAGVVALAVVNWRAHRGRYTPLRRAGVHYCALYWHFVDVVWLAVFIALCIDSTALRPA
jgi:cytochrome c oxidase subunit III